MKYIKHIKYLKLEYCAGEPIPDPGDPALREPNGQPGHGEEEEEGREGAGGGEQGGDRTSLSFAHQVYLNLLVHKVYISESLTPLPPERKRHMLAPVRESQCVLSTLGIVWQDNGLPGDQLP